MADVSAIAPVLAVPSRAVVSDAPTAAPASLVVPEALPAFSRGDFIGDQFQVIDVLGEGGFGIVYLARSLASNGIVALKTLRGELLRDPGTRALFEKEARIWLDLGAHPNLVRAHWIDEIGGRLYIAMEYVQAGAGRPNSLEGHLERGPVPLEKALEWAIQFCRGMEYAISRGIRCHRDIKPANILIGADGVARISDFGIAGLALVPEAPSPAASGSAGSAESADSGRTVAGTVFGTPTHMSPEQFVDAASCDERSDIYSFGVVLHQLASGGQLPFHPAPPPPEMAGRAGLWFWHAFRSLHSGAAPATLVSPLAAIVARSLRKKREDRYPGFAALRADLESLYEKTTGTRVAESKGEGETATGWNARGMSMASLNRWTEALACYDKAIALEPDVAALHSNRGNALRNLGRAREALEAFDRALTLDPLHGPAWRNKALLYAHSQRNDEALAGIEHALALDPTVADAWVIKGVLLGRLGRHPEAIAAYDHALELNPRDASAWFNKANSPEVTNRVVALQCLDQALANDPAHVSAWSLRGTLLGELGRPAEAVPCLREAVRLDPRDATLHYNLGNGWAALGRFEDAAACYEASLRLDARAPVAWYNLALTRFRLGQHAESVPLFERFLSFEPPDGGLRRTALRLVGELRAGRVPELGPLSVGARITPEEQASIDGGALPAIQAPLKSPSDSAEVAAPMSVPAVAEEPLPEALPPVDALNRLAAAHFGAGRFAEALETVGTLLRIDPRDAYALNTRANTLFRMGRRDDACEATAAAIEAAPGDAGVWRNRALIQSASGRAADACRSAIDLIEIAQAGGVKGAAIDEARDLLGRLQAQGVVPAPRSHLGWLGLGFASVVAGRKDAGLSFFDKAIEAAPASVEALRWKATALKEAKRADEALATCDRALALAPNDPEIHHDRGVVLAMLRELAPAVEAFDRALALNPDHAASLSDKGKYAAELGRRDEALRALRRAAALRPDHPAPWLNKALVEDLMKREEDALASFENFLARAKPEMRLQIESSKRRVEQLRARIAARKAPAALAPAEARTPPAPAPVPAPTPLDDPFLKAVAGLFVEDGDDVSEEEMARIAKAMDGDDPATLLEMLRKVGPAPAPAGPGAQSAPAGTAGAARPTGAAAAATTIGSRPNRNSEVVLPEVGVPKAVPRFSQDECLKRSEITRNQAHFDQALDWADQAIAADPRKYTGWAAKAEALFGAKRFAESAAHARRAIEINDKLVAGWSRLAACYDALEAPALALPAWDATISLSPRNVVHLSARGQCLAKLGRVEEALEAHETALVIDPRFSIAKFHKGMIEAALGRRAAALQTLQQFLALAPPNLAALVQQARQRIQELKA